MLLATGSLTFTETIGIVRVSRWTAAVAGVEFGRRTSVDQLLRGCSYSIDVQAGERTSIRTLRPSVQPNSASACVTAETRAFATVSFWSNGMSTPIAVRLQLGGFDALHRRGTVSEAMLYAFDLLWLDGADLRGLPLVDRNSGWRGCWAGAGSG
jgi:hypothetical protein